jgi:mannose-6-phosphate isomerase-like protein (cupin superfamily)
MEFANINDTMRTAKDQDKRFMPLFGSETFRSWILYFRPGEHTDMHFHMSPETFLVLQGKASVKGLKGEERVIGQNEIVFFGAKDYYQITNVGTEPLVLVGNRSEGAEPCQDERVVRIAFLCRHPVRPGAGAVDSCPSRGNKDCVDRCGPEYFAA